MVTFFAQVQQELYLFTPIMLPIISFEVKISSNMASFSVKGSAYSMVHSDSCLGSLSISDLDLLLLWLC